MKTQKRLSTSTEGLSVADKFTLAFKGAMKGDLAPIQVYLSAKGDVNRKDNFGWTLLMQASYKGHVDIVRYLVQHKKARINLKDKDGRNALYHACFHGFAEVASFLLTMYAEVDLATVMKASAKGILCVVEYWVNMGESVEQTEEDDPDETRMLMYACSGGHIHVAKFLIEDSRAQANVNAQDAGGKTALTYCCQNNHLHTADYLIAHCSAKVNYYTARKAAAKNFMKILKHFIENDGGEVNETDSQGWTFLMDAAFHGQGEAAQYLMSCGADLNMKERNGHTALYWACYKGHTKLASILLEAGSQIDLMTLVKMTEPSQVIEVCKAYVGAGGDLMKIDEKGRSLLSWACYEGRLDLVHWLVNQMKADINQKDDEGNSPLVWAQCSKKWSVAEFLIKVGAKNVFDTVKLAVENGNLGVVQAYVGRGLDVNKTDQRKTTLLMRAAKFNHIKIMISLVKCGAKLLMHDDRGKNALDYLPNTLEEKEIIKKLGAELTDCEGNTIAHIAAQDGNLQMIETLINVFHAHCVTKENKSGWTPLDIAMKYAQVSVVLHYAEMDDALSKYNHQGETPLHRCCRWGHLQVLQALLSNCEDEEEWRRIINMPSKKEGNTCLMIACKWGWLSIIEFLIETKSADVSVSNDAGQGVLHIAAENHHVNVVRYLLKNPQVHIENKDNQGNTAAEVCFINNLVDAAPLIFQRLEQRLPQESLTHFQMVNHFCEQHDPHEKIFSLENLNLISVSDFANLAGIRCFAALKEKNLLHTGKIVVTDDVKVLYLSLHWETPDHPDPSNRHFQIVRRFLKKMEKDWNLTFDYIYYPFGCITPNDCGHNEDALKQQKALPLAFLVASHVLVTSLEKEDMNGNKMSDLEGLCNQAWNSTEMVISQMLGRPTFLELHFNQEYAFQPLMYGFQNNIYSTSEKLIRTWSHLSNRQSKILWRNWCRARDISCLVGLTALAVKHCNSLNLFKVLSMSQIQKNFQHDNKFLAAFYQLGEVFDEQDRIILFRTLSCLVAFSLNYKVHDVGRPQTATVDVEDSDSDNSNDTDSGQYLNPVDRERNRRVSIQRTITTALQHKKAQRHSISTSTVDQGQKDSAQSSDVHHLRVKLTYAEKEAEQLKTEFKAKIIEYEAKIKELTQSLREEQDKRRLLSEEIFEIRTKADGPAPLDIFGSSIKFGVSRKNSIAGWSVTDGDMGSFGKGCDSPEGRGRNMSTLSTPSECSAALPFMMDSIEKRNSNANIRVEVIQAQIRLVEQQFNQLQTKSPASRLSTPTSQISPASSLSSVPKRHFSEIVTAALNEDDSDVEILAS